MTLPNRKAEAERLKYKTDKDALNSQMVAGQEASNAKSQEILKSLNIKAVLVDNRFRYLVIKLWKDENLIQYNRISSQYP